MREPTTAESSFLHLIQSNDPPNEEELLQIQEICRVPDGAIADIDQEIQSLEKKIDELREQKDRLVMSAKAHKTILSPLRRASTEVLQCIFAFCLPTKRNPVMHHSEAPVLLGRVCHRWRQVAYETPELWNAIHIVVPEQREGSKRWRSLYTEMKRWLDRSGELPLRISVDAETNISERMDDSFINLTLFLEGLKPYSRRWQCLELETPAERPVSLCTLGSDDVPLLEKFSIAHGKAPGTWTPPQTALPFPSFAFLRNAPRLQALTAMHFPATYGMPLVRYEQLTELHLHHPLCDLTTVLPNILEMCHNIKVCSIRHSLLASSASLPSNTIVDMPSLESLELYLSSPPMAPGSTAQVDIGSVLGILNTQNLRKLKLGGGFGIDVLPSIEQLVTRSECTSLEELVITSPVERLDTLQACLLLCPELKTLSLACADDGFVRYSVDRPSSEPQDEEPGDAILRAMLVTPDPILQNVVCPQLSHIKLMSAFHRYTPTLREFIDSRASAGQESGIAQLEKVVVTPFYMWRRNLGKKQVAREWDDDVKRWKEAGVKVKIDIDDRRGPGFDRGSRLFSPWRGLDSDAEDDDISHV
jgi:hypothetical protein